MLSYVVDIFSLSEVLRITVNYMGSPQERKNLCHLFYPFCFIKRTSILNLLQLEELRADIIDLKEMYREQVDLLVNRVNLICLVLFVVLIIV